MSHAFSARTKILFVIGVIFALSFIAGELTDNYPLRLATKTIPVLLMALYLVMQPNKGRFQWLIIIGLLLGASGDFFLEFSPDTFLIGLVSFLIGHIFYILAFLSDCRRPAWGVAIFAYLYGVAIYSFLDMGDMGDMALPVLLYILVIATMLWRAAARFHAPGVNQKSAKAGLLGSLFFVGSDSLLAITLFVYALPYAGIVIIIAYWLGQLGITLAASYQQHASMSSAAASPPSP